MAANTIHILSFYYENTDNPNGWHDQYFVFDNDTEAYNLAQAAWARFNGFQTKEQEALWLSYFGKYAGLPTSIAYYEQPFGKIKEGYDHWKAFWDFEYNSCTYRNVEKVA